MLVYITGTENKQIIENAIFETQMENTLLVGEPIIFNSINLLQEVRTTLTKSKEITTLLIDLSVISNDDDETLKAITILRHYNNDCRFIIVATERRIGDPLLSELVNMGIYNIITDEDEMLSKITYYTIKDETYKEASIYQLTGNDNENNVKKKAKKEKKSKEDTSKKSKIILKPLKQKVIISIIGSQNRVGVTHTSISLAYTLTRKGYRVAVVELNKNEDFKTLVNCYENKIYSNEISEFIKINQIDFYANVDIDRFTKIQGLNYDYIIIDNGDINNCDISEHNRADVKLVCFGVKAWEQRYLGLIFEQGEEVISNYRFIALADEKLKEEIIEEMKPSKVYFPKYNPEPFSEDSILLNCLDGYLYQEEKSKNKRKFLGIF